MAKSLQYWSLDDGAVGQRLQFSGWSSAEHVAEHRQVELVLREGQEPFEIGFRDAADGIEPRTRRPPSGTGIVNLFAITECPSNYH